MVDYEAWERIGLMIDSASGFVFIVLGVLLLFARPRTRTQTAFSLFAIGFGSGFAFQNLAQPPLDIIADGWMLMGLFGLPGAAAMAWLALRYPARVQARDRPAVIGGLVIMGLFAGLVLTVLGPNAAVMFGVDGSRLLAAASLTPVGLVISAMLGAAFIWASRAAQRAQDGDLEARDLVLAASALTLFVHVNTGVFTVMVLHVGGPGTVAFTVLSAVTTGLVAITLFMGGHWLYLATKVPATARRPFIAAGLATFAALAAGAAFASLTEPLVAQDLGLHGLTRFAGFLTFAYLILKRHMFDIDVRIKWTVSKTTVAAIILAIAFAASEGAQQFFGDRFDNAYVGIGAAALLVFAIAPLQKVGDKVADAAMPRVRPLAERSDDERASMYADVVRSAWEDGTLTRAERKVLTTVRDRLGLTTAEADAIERRALG